MLGGGTVDMKGGTVSGSLQRRVKHLPLFTVSNQVRELPVVLIHVYRQTYEGFMYKKRLLLVVP